MSEPILTFVRGEGWVYDNADFVTTLGNGKEVNCYYRKPVIGEWYTNFGKPGEYAKEDGTLNAKGMNHINTCTYGYNNDGTISKNWEGWREHSSYEEGSVYVVIVPVE